jgi:hypothetical protein
VGSKPTASTLGGSSYFADINGDGEMNLIVKDKGNWGFYARQFTSPLTWKPFHPFKKFPNLSTNRNDIRFVDLTGDGLSDILITQDNALIWYQSLGEEGYGDGGKNIQFLDEEDGPRGLFVGMDASIHLADMTGDGLNDLVRISNGEVCYWPNTGYGNFGRKITMASSPWFADYAEFDQRSRPPPSLLLVHGESVLTLDMLHLQISMDLVRTMYYTSEPGPSKFISIKREIVSAKEKPFHSL